MLTPSDHDRLMNEFEDIMSMMTQKDISVGDAIPVVYERDFADEHRIGQFGRLVYKDEQGPCYYAAPKEVWKPQNYDYKSRDFLSFANAWVNGDELPLTGKQLVEPSPNPTPKRDAKDSSRAYERAVLKESRKYGDLVLVDPSFGVMSECVSLGGGKVFLTEKDDRWHHQVQDFCNTSGKRLEKINSLDGEKGVQILPPGNLRTVPAGKWVRMIPNPDALKQLPIRNLSRSRAGRTSICSYETKRGYKVTTIFDPEECCYTWNPRTVDSLVGQDQRTYFLQSNIPMLLNEVEEPLMIEPPTFVAYRGEWIEIDGIRWLIDGDVVCDVQGRGTYMSRRARNSPPEGKHWAPLEEFGTHWLTAATLVPRLDPSVHKLDTLSGTVYGVGAQVEERVEPYEPGQAFCVLPSSEIQMEDRVQSLPSDDSLWLCMANNERNYGDYVTWKGSSGRYYQRVGYEGVQIDVTDNGWKEHVIRSMKTSISKYVVPGNTVKDGSLLFFSLQDYSRRVLGTIVGRYCWANRISSIGWNAKMNDSIGAKDSEIAHLTQVIASRHIHVEGNSGISIREVSKMGSRLTFDQIYRHLRLTREILVWDSRPSSIYDWQFVTLSSLDIAFRGRQRQVSTCDLDGRKWKEILDQCALLVWGQALYFTFSDAKVESFVSLLERNGYRCGVVTGDTSQLIVKWGY